MAIYHLHAKVFQRSKGKNVVAAAAYRRAAKLLDHKEGKVWDYRHKKNVVHTELIIPNDAPAWVQALAALDQIDRTAAAEQLWNKVEAVEKRVDAQLAREIEFALPIELSLEQNIKLAREFVHDQFALRGMIADWNVHWEEGNPHVHVMLSMRYLTEDGFGQRALAWNNRALLKTWRAQWAEYANFHLRLHQHDVKIDHRSYREQGIDLLPTVHQGKAVTDMERRGIETDIMQEAHHIRKKNLARIAKQPEILLDKLSAQSGIFSGEQLAKEVGRYAKGVTPQILSKIMQSIEHHDSVFGERTLAKAVMNFTGHADDFAEAMMRIRSSNQLIRLGQGEDGRDRFTTRNMFDLENAIQTVTDKMRKSQHVKISGNQINEVLKKYQLSNGKQLTDEQMLAVKHILQPSSISCLVGRAGTGKSFLLGSAKAVWEAQGLRVQGIALSGIAAAGLNQDAGINSRTIESFKYAIQKGQIILNHHDVVVMDEAGMTDSVSMMAVLKAVRAARAKLVMVGDHAQIQPVGPGACFRALVERLGFAGIHTVYRQNEEWQRQATVHLSAGKVAKALAAYDAQHCLHFAKNAQDMMAKLVNHWFDAREKNKNADGLAKDLSQFLVVAHRNDDVKQVNAVLRDERVKRMEIAEGYTVNGKHGEMKLSEGDRILFLKNDRKLGVSNGRFATIKKIHFAESGKITEFSVILDGQNKENNKEESKEIHINPREYSDFAYGYAATVHKVQGMTVDHAFVFAGGKSWNRNLTYVALSRHRETCHIYASEDAHATRWSLQKNLSRLGRKDSVLDFPLAFAERRAIDNSSLLQSLSTHLVDRLKICKEKIMSAIANRFNNQKNISMQPRLIEYVSLELEHTQMVHEMRLTKLNNPKLGRELSAKVLEHANKIKSMALEMMQHPEIKSELDKLRNMIIKPSLAQRGGFSAIQQRMKKNEWQQEDVQAVLRYLSLRTQNQSRSEMQDRDRGGRKR